MVIAITGPSGVGKTTVAEELVKIIGKCTNIDVDHIKHMNPSAFRRVVDEDGDVDFPYTAWDLLGENVGLLAQNYLSHGYDVIINGYLEVEAWVKIEEVVSIDYKFLLFPDYETNVSRDSNRNEQLKMGEKAVKRGREYFLNTDFYADFTKKDSSEQSIKETVEQIQVFL